MTATGWAAWGPQAAVLRLAKLTWLDSALNAFTARDLALAGMPASLYAYAYRLGEHAVNAGTYAATSRPPLADDPVRHARVAGAWIARCIEMLVENGWDLAMTEGWARMLAAATDEDEAKWFANGLPRLDEGATALKELLPEVGGLLPLIVASGMGAYEAALLQRAGQLDIGGLETLAALRGFLLPSVTLADVEAEVS